MDRIYLDHAATTPLRDEVREAMRPYLSDEFGNPSSVHAPGRSAGATLDRARERVAEVLGARPREIRFVRGGTESDNLAVLGRADRVRRAGRSPLLVVSAVEHRAVLESAEAAVEDDGELLRLGVEPDGTLELDALEAALEREPALVSVMWVNNETGMRLPVDEVADRCRRAGIPFHTDAVQAIGTVRVRVDEVPVDLLTATGHKIYGPRSTGILFVREGTALRPRLFGGGQEDGLRPGTEDVAGAVGMARALELAAEERESEAARLEGLRDELEARLRESLPDLRVHGGEAPRAPHVLNVGVPGADLETLLLGLDLEGVAVSSGSACSSGAVRSSHVLRALYGEAADEVAPVRFSLGRETGTQSIRRAAEATIRVARRARDGAAVAGAGAGPTRRSGT